MVTETCGGTMSGYWATGMAKSETSPAIVVTMRDDDRKSRPVDEDRREHRSSPRSRQGHTGVARTGVPGRRLWSPRR